MATEVLEMLYHDLCLLRNVVRMQSHVTTQGTGCFFAFNIRVIFAGFQQLVVCLIGDIVFLYILDKALFDRLSHRVLVLSAFSVNIEGKTTR